MSNLLEQVANEVAARQNKSAVKETPQQVFGSPENQQVVQQGTNYTDSFPTQFAHGIENSASSLLALPAEVVGLFGNQEARRIAYEANHINENTYTNPLTGKTTVTSNTNGIPNLLGNIATFAGAGKAINLASKAAYEALPLSLKTESVASVTLDQIENTLLSNKSREDAFNEIVDNISTNAQNQSKILTRQSHSKTFGNINEGIALNSPTDIYHKNENNKYEMNTAGNIAEQIIMNGSLGMPITFIHMKSKAKYKNLLEQKKQSIQKNGQVLLNPDVIKDEQGFKIFAASTGMDMKTFKVKTLEDGTKAVYVSSSKTNPFASKIYALIDNEGNVHIDIKRSKLNNKMYLAKLGDNELLMSPNTLSNYETVNIDNETHNFTPLQKVDVEGNKLTKNLSDEDTQNQVNEAKNIIGEDNINNMKEVKSNNENVSSISNKENSEQLTNNYNIKPQTHILQDTLTNLGSDKTKPVIEQLKQSNNKRLQNIGNIFDKINSTKTELQSHLKSNSQTVSELTNKINEAENLKLEVSNRVNLSDDEKMLRDMFFTKNKDGKWTIKQDFRNALFNAASSKALKKHIESKLEPTKANLILRPNEVAQEFMNMTGIKDIGSNPNGEKIKGWLSKAIEDYLGEIDLQHHGKLPEEQIHAQSGSHKIVSKTRLEHLFNEKDNMLEHKQALSDITNEPSDIPHIHKSSKINDNKTKGKIDLLFNEESKFVTTQIKNYLNVAVETKYVKTVQAEHIYNYYNGLRNRINKGDKNALIELLRMKDKSDLIVDSKKSINEGVKKEIQSIVDDFNREMDYIDYLHNNTEPGDFLTFDAKIVDNTRYQYKQEINPQNSGILMDMYRPMYNNKIKSSKKIDDILSDKQLEKDFLTLNNSMFSEPSKVDNIINETIKNVHNVSQHNYNKIINKVFNNKDLLVEKTKSLGSLIDRITYMAKKDNKEALYDKVNMFGTVDAKASNLANTLAMTSITSKMIGIDFDSSKFGEDLRNEIANVINIPGIGKDEIKPLFTGFFYEGDPLSLMSNEFGEKIFNKWITGDRTNPLVNKMDELMRSKINHILSTLNTQEFQILNDDKFKTEFNKLKEKLNTLTIQLKEKAVKPDNLNNSYKDFKETLDSIKNEYKEFSNIFMNIGSRVNILVKRDLLANKKVGINMPKDILEYTEQDKAFVIESFKSTYGHDIVNAIYKVMREKGLNDLIELREVNNQIYKVAKLRFYSELNKKRFSNISTDYNKLLDEIKSDTGIHLPEDIKSKIVLDLENQDNGVSLNDLFNIMAKHNVLTEDIMKWKRVDSIIPYIESSDGRKIPIAQFSSNMFHFEDKYGTYDTGSIGFFRIFSPIYTISQDSLLMSHAFTDPNHKLNAVMRFDALYGDQSILAGSKVLNKELATMFLKANIASEYKKLLNSVYLNFRPDEIDEIVLNEVAKQDILKSPSEVEINHETIENAKKQYSQLITDKDMKIKLQNRISKLEQNIIDRRTNIVNEINNGKKLNINNFQFDSDHKISNFEIDKQFLDDTKPNLKSVDNKDVNTLEFDNFEDLNTKELSNVVPNGNKSFVRLTDYSDSSNKYSFSVDTFFVDGDLKSNVTFLKNTAIASSVEGIPGRSKFYTQGLDAKIQLNESLRKDYAKALDTLFHELSHIGMEYSFDIKLNDNKEKTSLTIDKILAHIDSNIDKSKKLETTTQMLAELYKNEIVMKNRSWFANYLEPNKDGKVNINKLLSLGNITINNKRINTLKQLIDHFDTIGEHNIANVLKQYAENMNALVNQAEIQSLLMKEFNIDKFSNKSMTTFEPVDGNPNLKNMTIYDNFTAKALKIQSVGNFVMNIKEMSLSQLFRIDKEREAIEKAMAQAKAAETELAQYTDSIRKTVNGYIDDISKSINIEDSGTFLTKTLMYGFHKLLSMFKDKNGNIIDVQSFVDKLPQMIHSNLLILQKELKIDSIQTLEKHINSFNKRKFNGGIIDPIQFLNEISRNKYFDSQKAKIMLENIIAGKRIQDMPSDMLSKYYTTISHNYDKFHRLYTIAGSDSFRNDHILFGINLRANLQKYNKVIVLQDAPDNSLGSISINLKEPDEHGNLEITKYISVVDKDDYRIGQQKDQLVLPFTNDIQKGILSSFDTNGKIFHNGRTYDTDVKRVYITTHNIDIKKENDKLFNFDIGSSLVHNAYTKFVNTVLWKKTVKQWNVLQKNGIIISANKFSKMSTAQKDYWKPITNEYVQQQFGNWYVKKDYIHYINGTDGIRIQQILEHLTSKDVAKTLVSGIKTVAALIDIAKELVIKYRPKAYINQYISSNLISLINSQNPYDYMNVRNSHMKNILKQYRELTEKKVELSIENQLEHGSKQKELDDIERQFHNNKQLSLIKWSMENGIGDTIVQDAYDMTTSTSMRFINEIMSKGEADRVIDNLEAIIGSKSKLGKMTFELMSEIELIPKLSLFISNYKTYLSQGLNTKLAREKALGDVLMSHPTYNNLPTPLAIYDLYSPFTKYYASIPKMFLFALMKSPKRFITINAMIMAGSQYSWSLDNNKNNNTDKWYKENGFGKIPGVPIAFYYYSMDPYIPAQYMHINGPMNPIGVLSRFAYDPVSTLSPITIMR